MAERANHFDNLGKKQLIQVISRKIDKK